MSLFKRWFEYLKTFNIYSSENTDEEKKRNEVLSSRSYVIILLLIIIGYSLYQMLIEEKNLIKTSEPTYAEYERLKNQSLEDFQCPCKDISIALNDFLSIEVTYHEICSSDLISQRWIEYLFNENLTSIYFELDIRFSGFAQFEIIRHLCSYAFQTIEENLKEFYSNEYLSENLISKTKFHMEIDSFVELFKEKTLKLFQDPIELFRLIVKNQRFYSAIDTKNTFLFRSYNGFYRIEASTLNYTPFHANNLTFDCYQGKSKINRLPSGIFHNKSLIHPLPGLYIGCLPIESVFHSNIECLSNQTCLDLIRNSIDSTKSFHCLKQTKQSRFQSNETFEILIKEMFIESFQIDQSHLKYYSQCQPLFCQYRQKQKQDFVEILILIISFSGGLTILLRYSILILIKYVRKKFRQRQTNERRSTRVKQRFVSLVHLIRQFNQFNSYSTNETIRRKEIYLTRIYFFLLISSLLIYFLYSLILVEMKTVTLEKPSEDQYNHLLTLKSKNLICPCSSISMKYSQLIEIEFEREKICSSVYVSDLWYETNYWTEPSESFDRYDLRYLIHHYWNILAKLCHLSDEFVKIYLKRFSFQDFLSQNLLMKNDLNERLNKDFHQFQLILKESFQEDLQIIRNLISFNHLISILDTNGIPSFVSQNQIQFHSRAYSDCLCSRDLYCRMNLTIVAFGFVVEEINGMFIGCSIFDSLSNSYVKCLYEFDCLIKMKSYMHGASQLYHLIEHFNVSNRSNFKFENLIENLFIENWKMNLNYSSYYSRCQPEYCQYSIEKRTNFLLIMTEIIAIYGGLAMILKLFTKFTLNFLRKETTTTDERRTLIFFVRKLKTKLNELNFFEDIIRNDRLIRYQRMLTKLYLLSVLLTLLSLCFYSLMNKKLSIDEMKLNDLKQYESFEKMHSSNLSCPCEMISLNYRDFLSISRRQDQFCSSKFFDKSFRTYLYSLNNLQTNDFHSLLSNHFSLMNYFCFLTNDIFEKQFRLFQSNQFINQDLISKESFTNYFSSMIQQFQRIIYKNFQRKFSFILNLIESNQLISYYQINWKFNYSKLSNFERIKVYPTKSFNSTCNCITNRSCLKPLLPFGLANLYLSCSPLNSFLKSSFSCLNNRECIESLIAFVNQSTFSCLNDEKCRRSLVDSVNRSSIFNENSSPIESLLVNRMIEDMIEEFFRIQWNQTDSYERYFNQCQAKKCFYSTKEHFQIVKFLKIFLGLYAGLSAIFKIVLPIVFHVILFLYHQRATQIEPYQE